MSSSGFNDLYKLAKSIVRPIFLMYIRARHACKFHKILQHYIVNNSRHLLTPTTRRFGGFSPSNSAVITASDIRRYIVLGRYTVLSNRPDSNFMHMEVTYQRAAD